MFEKYKDQLSSNAKQLLNDGYFTFRIKDINKLEYFKDLFSSYLNDICNLNPTSLDELHDILSIDDLNDVRYGFFKHINNNIQNIVLKYLDLAKEPMIDVVGSELAANRTLNFSIQLPNDDTSLLPIHSDVFSGESAFQINLWVPLVDVFDTNSMFIFNPKFSKSVLQNIKKFEEKGIDHLLNENKKEYKFIDLKYGEALIFTPTCLHGNVINNTNKTRISFNCRYKNIFSPYNESEENEKKIGSFYEPINLKVASIIGFEHEFGK